MDLRQRKRMERKMRKEVKAVQKIFQLEFLRRHSNFLHSRKCKSCHQTIRSCPCYKYLQSSNHFSVARHDLPPEFDQGAGLTSCETSSPPRSVNDDDGEKHAMPCHVPLHLVWSYLVCFSCKRWSDAIKINLGNYWFSPPSASFFPFSCAASDPSMSSPQQKCLLFMKCTGKGCLKNILMIFREGLFFKHFYELVF